MTYKQEEIKPYENKKAKGEQVEEMFNNIAHSYDLLNHILSWGIDKRWRKAAVNSLKLYAPKRILDVATGTGDFAILAAHELQPQEVLGIDLSEGMMRIAFEKVKKENLEKIVHFQKEDCMKLSLESNKFDAVLVAYGVRNFENLDKGLQEMLRVLKSGGHLVIIELTSPKYFPMKQLFWLYSHVIMPIVGKIVSQDSRAYSYLPATMENFPQGEIMQQILQKNGFANVKFKRFTFGLSTLYTALRP